MRSLSRSWWLALASVLVIAACGDSKSSLNPTAPSALSGDSVNAETGVTDGGESSATGRGNGGGNGNSGGGNGNGNSGGGNGNGNSGGGNGGGNSGPGNGGGGNSGPGNGGGGNSGPGNGNVPPPADTKVELEGLVTAVGAASIAVNTQTVLVTSDTVIRHGNRRFALSDISIGDRVHVKATRTTSTDPAAPATLRANEIKLQNRDDDDDDDDDDDEDDDRAVTVVATDALASETGSNTGSFRLHRDSSNPLTQLPLTVTFTLNGTATNGVDYTSVPLTATFPAGEDSIEVLVTPITDALVEGAETVVLTLTGVGPYLIGTPASAVIVLNDAPAPAPLVSVAASDPAASETGDPATFQFTRTGALTSPLAITVTINGTATNGLDYTTIATTVNFAAGQATADVTVTPLVDALVDPLETVVITIVDGAGYDLGSSSTATVTISGS
jgi:Domain of unknown function (DUF5666)/Calx-beta domain